MLRFWRKTNGAAAEEVSPSIPVAQLSPHLLRDLNLQPEHGFLSPNSIRIRKLPPAPLF